MADVTSIADFKKRKGIDPELLELDMSSEVDFDIDFLEFTADDLLSMEAAATALFAPSNNPAGDYEDGCILASESLNSMIKAMQCFSNNPAESNAASHALHAIDDLLKIIEGRQG